MATRDTGKQPRQPKGIPTGGEYAPGQDGGPATTLDVPQGVPIIGFDYQYPPSSSSTEFLSAPQMRALPPEPLRKRPWLSSRKPAAERNPGTTWWEDQAALKPPFAKAPRINFGDRIGGKGFRQVTYAGAGLAVNMPSVEACRRKARELGGDPATFDIPVEVRHVKSNSVVQGWVRASKFLKPPPPRWGVKVLDNGVLPPSVSGRVSESVTALLESRHRRRGLREYRDIAEHAIARRTAEGVRLYAVHSKAVKAIGYDPRTQTAFVVHHDYTRKSDGVKVPERVYAYQGVSPEKFAQFAHSDSIGAALPRLKEGTTRVQAEWCEHCNLVRVAGVPHRCAI